MVETRWQEPVVAEISQSGRAVEQRLSIPFDDNRLLAALVGGYNQHLSQLEQELGVSADTHGNVVTITGSTAQTATAKDVLEWLYRRLEAGEMINAGDVKAAVRHIAGDGNRPRMPRRAHAGRTPPKSFPPLVSGSPAEFRTRKKAILGRTEAQSAYLMALDRSDLVFGIGPAGTGKTYLAVAYAAACLERGSHERIILSRPAVEAGERLGFLPGDMKEKVDPYLRPLYDALYDVLPFEKVEKGIDNKDIEIAPLAFMRGRTLSHAVVILDEAQNCTSMQMKMFLTRLGEGSKMIITGDPSQIDLPRGVSSGLNDAVSRLRSIDEIETITFDAGDVVRRDIVAKIVAAYDEAEGSDA